MKNLLSKSILAVTCLSCLTIWMSCNESIKVDAVYITTAVGRHHVSVGRQ